MTTRTTNRIAEMFARTRAEGRPAVLVFAPAGWPEPDRRMAAAMLDVLWSVMSYDRLVTSWQLDPGQAARAVTWVIGLVEAAIREGRGPGPPGAG